MTIPERRTAKHGIELHWHMSCYCQNGPNTTVPFTCFNGIDEISNSTGPGCRHGQPLRRPEAN
jgi:hypothetical protein